MFLDAVPFQRSLMPKRCLTHFTPVPSRVVVTLKVGLKTAHGVEVLATNMTHVFAHVGVFASNVTEIEVPSREGFTTGDALLEALGLPGALYFRKGKNYLSYFFHNGIWHKFCLV